MKKLILVIAITLAAIGVSAQTTAFVGVNVVPMDRERILANQTVIVKDGVIIEIGDAKKVKVPAGAVRVDGAGKYLIPGLVDMHVHLGLATNQSFSVLVANGVTTVRDMGGDLRAIDEWRDDINAGRIIGPQIFRAGPYVDGPKDAPDRLVVNTDQDVASAVKLLKEKRVDLIKIHNAVPRDAFFPLVREARKSGLRVVGHVPLMLTPLEAVAAGQAGIEHMTSLIEGVFTNAIKNKRTPLEALTAFDDGAAGQLFEQMSMNDVWMTPNLIAEQAITFRLEIEEAPDPRAKYVAASLKKYWATAFAGRPTSARKLLLNRYFELVKLMNLKQVRLLAGTDLGLRDIYPGFSLHDELELLVKGGLTPFEALRAATQNPASFFGPAANFGTLREKKRSDMVLLLSDPTIDIRNTRKIEGVVLRGRYFSKNELEKMLAEAATAAENS